MSQINRDQEGDFIYNFAGNFQTKLFMNEIGTKIRELRKKKGFSQEELAESACVSLRTVQRIENDENEPRGNTMQQICKVLGVNAEEILDYGKQTDPRYLLCFHLSVLSFLVIPLGNIILPMILWQSRKENIVGLREAGIKLLNYQIVWTVCLSLSVIVLALLKIQHVDNSQCPSISVDINMMLVVPANVKGPVPVLMMFGRPSFPSPAQPSNEDLESINIAFKEMMSKTNPEMKAIFDKYPAYQPITKLAGPGFFAPAVNGNSAPTEQLLAAGWGYVTIDPSSVQADNGAGLTRGIIGLVNKGQPRSPEEWGALRAWA